MPKLLSSDTNLNPTRLDLKVVRPVLDLDLDLKLMLGLTIIALASIYLPFTRGTALQTVLSLAFVVLVPGYSLISALFPGKAEIDALERLMLSLGLSVIIIPLIGLWLNFTFWGIRLNPVVISLSVFSTFFIFFASHCRSNLPEDERFSLDPMKTVKAWAHNAFPDNSSRLDKALTMFLILSIILSIGTIAFVIVFPQQGEKFTEFYILGPDGKAVNYTTNYILGNNGTYIVGIGNHEYRNVTYTILVQLTSNGRDIGLYSDVVTLADNQTVEKAVTVKPDLAGSSMKLQFLLFMDGNMTAPYRECHVWIDVTDPAAPVHSLRLWHDI